MQNFDFIILLLLHIFVLTAAQYCCCCCCCWVKQLWRCSNRVKSIYVRKTNRKNKEEDSNTQKLVEARRLFGDAPPPTNTTGVVYFWGEPKWNLMVPCYAEFTSAVFFLPNCEKCLYSVCAIKKKKTTGIHENSKSARLQITPLFCHKGYSYCWRLCWVSDNSSQLQQYPLASWKCCSHIHFPPPKNCAEHIPNSFNIQGCKVQQEKL